MQREPYLVAAQYSNKQFFRKIPNLYLAQYFARQGIALGTDIAQLDETDAEAIQALLNGLDAGLVAGIEADFQGVNALACEGGSVALVDEAHFHDDEAFVSSIAGIEGYHAKAMWAFLSKPIYWRGAALFLHADNVSAAYWKKRKGFNNLPPHVDDADIKALANAISQYFYSKEGRGKNCIVEPYRRNQKEYFFAYPEDFAQTAIEWVGGTLKNQAHHPAFEVIFVYCGVEGSLDIYAPKNPKAIEALQAIFAEHILKLEQLEKWEKDKRVYELNPVIDDGFEFKFEPSSGITDVLVTRLRATLKQDRKQRIIIEADAHKDANAVYTLLDQLKVPPYEVTQLTIKVFFEGLNKARTVNITYPNSCALNHEGNDLKIRKMLAQSGLEPKAVVV
jgi:hypothetical protein